MKKIISLLLVLVMSIACLTACTKEEPEKVTPTTAPVATASPVPATPTTAPTEAPAGPSVDDAKDYLFSMYRDSDGATTASDYEVVGVVKVDGVTFNITWTVDAASGVTVGEMNSKKMVTIDVDEKTNTEIKYNLIGTITDANGNKAEIKLAHNVPAYKEFSWAEYVAASDDTTVVVSGVITALIGKSKGNSSNCIYFEDADGGYYLYNLGSDPVADLGLKIGNTIRVTGTKSTYSGTYEIVNASVEVLDTGVTTIEPADYTELFLNAATLKDEALTAKQSSLVTVKGVTIIGIGTDTTYYMWQLGEKQSYARLSSSVCPITADEQAAFKDSFNGHIGYLADVTGILTLYDGAFYISPVTQDCFTNFALPNKTDAEKVAFEAEGLGIPAKVNTDTTVTLPSAGITFTDVAIAYEVTGAEVADGVLALVQTEQDQTVTVKATLTCGAEKLEAEFEIKVEAKADDLSEAAVLEKAFALAEGEAMSGKQVLRGTIVEIPTAYSADYNNVTVNIDCNGQVVQCFRLVGGEELKVGDVITVMGNLKNYKGTVEFDAKCTYSKDLSVDQMKMNITLEKAAALEENTALPGTQVLCGTIVEIPTAYSADYNNVTVNIDVNGTVIQCFRLIGGADLKVGDVITVTGNIKNYKGTVEFDAKCTYLAGEQLAAAKSVLVLTKAAELAEGEVMPNLQTVTGTITAINTEYSADYNNITVTIAAGDQSIQCFRLIGGSELKVGDVITVTGNIKNYKGTIEFDAKCTYVAAGAAPAVVVTPEEPKPTEAPAAVTADPSNPEDIIAKAFSLADGQAMEGTYTLTGAISEINTAYSADYGNITVTITIGDKAIQCFRLVGGEDLKVGDTITVTGVLKNYKGTVEFDAKCTYTK